MGAGHPTLYHAGLNAATVTLAFALAAEKSGAGQYLDVSIFESAASMIELFLASASYSGKVHHYLKRTSGARFSVCDVEVPF